jgi:hypothetical protein
MVCLEGKTVIVWAHGAGAADVLYPCRAGASVAVVDVVELKNDRLAARLQAEEPAPRFTSHDVIDEGIRRRLGARASVERGDGLVRHRGIPFGSSRGS